MLTEDPDQRLTWPPTLAQLKNDLSIDLTDTRDDEVLLDDLEAAMFRVRDFHAGRYEFLTDAFGAVSELPPVPSHVVRGTIRQAGRWFNRRRTPDGVINAGELGTARIPSFDSDIEQMLGMGRWQESWLV